MRVRREQSRADRKGAWHRRIVRFIEADGSPAVSDPARTFGYRRTNLVQKSSAHANAAHSDEAPEYS